MRPVSARTTIDAPREQVFSLISDLAFRPSFCDHFQEDFHLQRIESRGVGASARFHLDAARFPIWMETVIAEIDPPHRLLERGRGGRQDRIPMGTAWELTEGPGGSTTEVTVTHWSEPELLVDKLRTRLGAGRWHKRRWRRALERLKEIAESGERPEPLRVGGTSRL